MQENTLQSTRLNQRFTATLEYNGWDCAAPRIFCDLSFASNRQAKPSGEQIIFRIVFPEFYRRFAGPTKPQVIFHFSKLLGQIVCTMAEEKWTDWLWRSEDSL